MDFDITKIFEGVRRTEVAKNTMCSQATDDEDRLIFKKYLDIEKYAGIITRVSILPMLFLLYKRNFFEK